MSGILLNYDFRRCQCVHIRRAEVFVYLGNDKHSRTLENNTEGVVYSGGINVQATEAIRQSQISSSYFQIRSRSHGDPPGKQKYETLKNKLILIYQECEKRQLKKLRSEMELSDQKEPQLLRHMKYLARDIESTM